MQFYIKSVSIGIIFFFTQRSAEEHAEERKVFVANFLNNSDVSGKDISYQSNRESCLFKGYKEI